MEEGQIEQLFLDVWGRQWQKLGGGREEAASADLFQVYVRAPASALSHLHRVQFPALFFEPRSSDGAGAHSGFSVVWLPGADYEAASHAMRTCEKAITVARLGLRFGVRTREADEQLVFQQLRPQHQYVRVKVNARYRVHPLPFGCQRTALLQLIRAWGWEAKPLQPDKGSSEGAAWLVGAAADPPAQAMPLDSGHVLITKLQDINPQRAKPQICASAKTLRSIRYDDPVESQSPDPWAHGNDPGARARSPKDMAPPPGLSQLKPAVASTSKIEQLGAELKQDLKGLVQTELAQHSASAASSSDQEVRLRKLEVWSSGAHATGSKVRLLVQRGWCQGGQPRPAAGGPVSVCAAAESGR